MVWQHFHSAVSGWFQTTFDAYTEVQRLAWQAIAQHPHVLIAAPTGSGKTLAAFLYAIDALIREGLSAPLPDATRVLYISPLKALSTDIQINLQQPLQGIRLQLLELGYPDVAVNAWVRTGDTPQSERQKAAKSPPHIVVTTPETFYLLLTSESGRRLLSTVETAIIDEIHAMAGSKRGAHLSLSLERLEEITGRPLKRIGLSATQKPIQTMADFLVGQRPVACAIVDTGHARARDLALEIPDSPLEALMANAVWDEVYDRLQHLIESHSTTLIFVNTRRLAERAARYLAERLGEQHVMSHHGSVAKEKRQLAEQRLKRGELRCMVATASLELGIDIGQVDLVCQLGSPRSISVFLQRVGRSGHAVGAIPKGRLFPLSRDELVETTALLKAARDGELDQIHCPRQPLDVLAQQIVAEVAAREWGCEELFAVYRRAWPYRELTLAQFEQIVQMLAQGFSTRRGRRSAHLHFDIINRRLRAREGSRLIALTNGGVIPDQFDFDVILIPENLKVGTLNEDFSIESMPGDIFQLGNTCYRVVKIEQGRMLVSDAHGESPTIPFWFGEAPGRSDELSLAVSQLRAGAQALLQAGEETVPTWLCRVYGIPQGAAEQLSDYLTATWHALECLPHQQTLVFERFLDEVGDMHLVIHAPFGSRLLKAWGLALRKRFCRKFNFELQAAALEDTLILSLSAVHSFPLEEVVQYLHANTVTELLTQAVLDAPLFATRWRWNACIALAVKRFKGGRRSPPYFQRADAEDLSAAIFPDQLACLENIAGEREIPDHPLVRQTLDDCLHEAMDVDGLVRLLQALGDGDVKVICRDLAGPSPMAQEIITARPYAFLDDAPAEERRTLAVRADRFADPRDAAQLQTIQAEAVRQVCEQAWPLVRHADELHDALVLLGCLTADEASVRLPAEAEQWFEQLRHQRRACRLAQAGQVLWVAAERLTELQALFPQSTQEPILNLPESLSQPTDAGQALIEIVRSRLECLGPVTSAQLVQTLGIADARIDAALLSLEQQGFVIRGRFGDGANEQWCERHLLARIQRYSLKQRRQEIEAVSIAEFMRFLFRWQGVTEAREGAEALASVLEQLQGFAVAAASWEAEIIPARIRLYTPDMLDGLCAAGRFAWLRLKVAETGVEKKHSPLPNAPISIVERRTTSVWRNLLPLSERREEHLSAHGQALQTLLQQHGALFFDDLVQASGLLRTQVEIALGELVNNGLLSSDYFAGLRALIRPESHKRRAARAHFSSSSLLDQAGRWSLLASPSAGECEDNTEFLARVLLKRYGIVFRLLLEREPVKLVWRDLLKVYWRLEARGEIRGGRFVTGIAGEQFALPEALPLLKRMRRQSEHGELQLISATDPLNLFGILPVGEKIPALPKNKIVCRDGVPVLLGCGRETKALAPLNAETLKQAERMLAFKRQAAGYEKRKRRWAAYR